MEKVEKIFGECSRDDGGCVTRQSFRSQLIASGHSDGDGLNSLIELLDPRRTGFIEFDALKRIYEQRNNQSESESDSSDSDNDNDTDEFDDARSSSSSSSSSLFLNLSAIESIKKTPSPPSRSSAPFLGADLLQRNPVMGRHSLSPFELKRDRALQKLRRRSGVFQTLGADTSDDENGRLASSSLAKTPTVSRVERLHHSALTRLEALFDQFDEDGDGRLSRRGLCAAFSKIVGVDANILEDAEVDALVRGLGTDERGLVTRQHFVDGIAGFARQRGASAVLADDAIRMSSASSPLSPRASAHRRHNRFRSLSNVGRDNSLMNLLRGSKTTANKDDDEEEEEEKEEEEEEEGDDFMMTTTPLASLDELSLSIGRRRSRSYSADAIAPFEPSSSSLLLSSSDGGDTADDRSSSTPTSDSFRISDCSATARSLIADFDVQRAEAEQRAIQLEDSLRQSEREASSLAARLRERQEELERQKLSNVQLGERVERAESESVRVARQFAAAQRQLAELEESAAERAGASERDVAERKRALERARGAAQAQAAERGALLERLAVEQRERDELERQLSESRQRVAELSTQCSEIRALLDQERATMMLRGDASDDDSGGGDGLSLADELSTASGDIVELERQCVQLRERVARADGELAATREQRRVELEAALRGHTGVELEARRQRSDALASLREQTDVELAEARRQRGGELASLRAELQGAREQLASAERQLQQRADSDDGEQRKLTDIVDQLSRENQRFRDTCDAERQLAMALRRRSREQQLSAVAVSDELERLRALWAQAADDATQRHEQLDRLRAEMDRRATAILDAAEATIHCSRASSSSSSSSFESGFTLSHLFMLVASSWACFEIFLGVARLFFSQSSLLPPQ
jgi:Ca2+-binding EF-hand superfamily protein